ncbi:PAS domain-containing protein [Jiella pelagia]|uniref:Blue-light-activated histidine kinase n=1 Tax=Jiella pelagia TaxID=2986949 RepID=A0ABY7C5P6_9HYPH|nr:PAS domain-containing protein [Jiella pelagia]WAP70150.1 PAS domain-containing protein [Jiella pelagia]
MNEELQAVNAELKNKLDNISTAHSDLQNLTAATEIGTLFLDEKLRIRMFTPPVVDLFNIAEMDIGRAITDFTNRLSYEEIGSDVARVLRDLTPVESEIRSKDNRWFMMRLRPYRTIEDRISGTVLTFIDITDRVEAEHKLRESERRFRALVQASSQVLYRMSPQWREMRQLSGSGFLSDMRAPNPEWLEHYILPEEQPRVRAAIHEVIADKKPFELEHRVRLPDGATRWTLSRAVPIIDENGEIEEWFGAATDVTAGKVAEEALRGSEESLRLALEVGGLGTWDRDLLTGECIWSANQYRIFGLEVGEAEPSEAAWLECVHPDDLDEVKAAMATARDEHSVFEREFRIQRPDGATRWCFSRGQFYYDREDKPVRMIGVVEDTTERREWSERQQVMVAELQHRTRNLLAVVRSIVGQTIKASGTLEEFRDRLNDRLAALSRVQGLMSRSDKEPITLRALITAELEALGAVTSPERLSVEGPDVPLRNAAVQTLALGLHELATNARKYGALANDAGHLAIEWRSETIDGEAHLVIDWIETGGNARADGDDASHKGYGQELIEKALPYTLGAKTSHELTAGGVRCTIALPMSGPRRVIRDTRDG